MTEEKKNHDMAWWMMKALYAIVIVVSVIVGGKAVFNLIKGMF